MENQSPGTQFTPATEVTPVVDYSALRVPDTDTGWSVTEHDHRQVRWETPAGYWVEIRGVTADVFGEVPDENPDNPHSISIQHSIKTIDTEAPSKVRDWALNWMQNHSLNQDDTHLTEYTGIGDRTSEYLQMVYDVSDASSLYHFMSSNPGIATAMFGDHYNDLKTTVSGKVVEQRR